MRYKNINKLLISLCLFTASSLGVASFAWGTASRYVTLENLQIGVQSDAEIEIGLRDLNTSEINYYKEDKIDHTVFEENGYDISSRYRPISSSYSSNWLVRDENGKFDENLLPEFSTNYDVNGDINTDPGKANYGYFQFELFFRCTTDPVKFKLSSSTLVSSDRNANHLLASEKNYDEEKEKQLNNIEKSLRISILTEDEYYIIDPYKEDTYLGGRLVGSADGYYKTYIKDGKVYEMPYGEFYEDKLVYDELLLEDEGTRDPYSIFVGKSKKGTYPLNLEQSYENGAFKKEESIDIDSLSSNNNIFNNYVITDKENHEYELKETRIVITYYIEGWDKDNTDLVCEGNFLSNLVFEADYARSDIYS